MPFSRLNLQILCLLAAAAAANPALAQIGVPEAAPTAGRDTLTAPKIIEAPLVLKASLRSRMLIASRGDSTLRTFAVAIGKDNYPTPVGTYIVRKMIWNPSWRPPPGSDWARGKTAKGPGDPRNPMKVVKIFFREPDYYIHGTDDVESLGSAESHGCLRMHPQEVADLAKIIMEHGGQPREENWFWRIIHSRREEKVVYLNTPITLTIGE
jgi:lipoprotein-anchoring transpeptidase ErfK/SrfK